MSEPEQYKEQAKNILKAEIKRKGLSYKQLAERLSVLGVEETDRNLANKISRGSFTAAFFLLCLDAIGVETVHVKS